MIRQAFRDRIWPGNRGWIGPGIAATYIGTVVGAGFASGQEICRFFSLYGGYSWWGIILAVLILGWGGVRLFYFGAVLKPTSYRDFLIFLLGPRLAPVMDALLFGFLVILIGVMFAGCGALFTQLHLGYWTGIILTGLCLILVLYKELAGLISSNVVIVPCMFLGCLVVAIRAILSGSMDGRPDSANGYGLLAAIQFSSYNLVLSMPVLLSLGKHYPRVRVLAGSGWVGSLGLGIMTALINWAILSHWPEAALVPLPMAELAKSSGLGLYWGYAFILWAEMLSTLIADVYGVTERLQIILGWPFGRLAAVVAISGILIGQIGFSNLITYCYPFFGCVCLIVLLLILCKPKPSRNNGLTGGARK